MAVKTELGVCSVSNLLDTQNPKDVLNEYSDATKPTAEELEMLRLRPGGSGALHAYYVPRMSANNRGEAFLKINTPDLPEAVVVSDAAAEVDTLAHEIGHILLGNDHLDSEPDNVMAGGTRNYGVDKVKPEQCAKI